MQIFSLIEFLPEHLEVVDAPLRNRSVNPEDAFALEPVEALYMGIP